MINPTLEQSERRPPTGELVAEYDLTREIGYYQLVWRRLRRHRLAVLGGCVLPNPDDEPRFNRSRGRA